MTKPIHPVRTFLRGFAVGCVTIASLVTIVSSQNHADRIWSSVPVEELSQQEQARRLLTQTYDGLNNAFYRELTNEDVHAFINGGLQALDTYSSYVPAQSYRALSGNGYTDEERAQQPYRLGIMGTSTDKAFVINTAVPGSPAQKAGLRPGDVLVSVRGEDVRELPGKDAFEKLLAAVDDNPGTTFSFGVERGVEEIVVEVAPAQLEPVYAYDMGSEEGIPHIVITGFYPGMARTVEDILYAYRQREDIRGVVLDVRDNVGGRVNEVEDLASLFSESGTVIYSSQARMEGTREYFTKGLAPFKDLRVAVVTNSQSASASEILAGFFQGNALGQVVGQTTFGKGTVQTVMPVQGSGAIRVTIGSYKDAGGRVIQDKGVTPDIVIETAEGVKLERAVFGEYDEALVRAREWISMDVPAGSITTHARPSLPDYVQEPDL